ncbi:hypothetical protein [Nocardioides mangrovi]|uniref:Lipoprotein n=1 Tax=Nocardioides mangrovi TaxID=2874580 RepID=A0ABS7UEA0_9ACTN|nr:hypothetical protein [Nocardioides mangrovi]MBZ5739328.1 hypothetical protein [Nocardioides mangrovi]
MRAWARRTGLVAAGAVLALGGLTACGGSDGGDGGGGSGSDAPADASKDDFCEAFSGLYDAVLSQSTSGETSNAIKAFKDWANDMKDVGTPSDMPDDARQGFEVFIDAALKIDDDASVDDLQNFGDDLPQSDQDAGEAFGDWATQNCPSAIPTDLPSVDPSAS